MLRQLLQVVVWTLGIYAVLWVATLLVWPPEAAPRNVDATRGQHSVYGSDIREVVYSLPGFCQKLSSRPDVRRIIVLGSSSAKAYRPDILRSRLGADEVDNLETDGSNISQIRQLVTDLRTETARGSLKSVLFVLVTNYILFVSNKDKWHGGFTYYEAEKVRHGLYTGEANGITPVIGPRLMRFAVEALRPVFALDTLLGLSDGIGVELVRRFWSHPKVDVEFVRMLKRRFPQAQQSEFGEEQFIELDRLIREIRASGGDIMFVEQPIEAFERTSLPIHSEYWTKMVRFAKEHDVVLVDMSESAGDKEFSDPLHGKESVWPEWTERLASALRGLASGLVAEENKGARCHSEPLDVQKAVHSVGASARLDRDENTRNAETPFEGLIDCVSGHRE